MQQETSGEFKTNHSKEKVTEVDIATDARRNVGSATAAKNEDVGAKTSSGRIFEATAAIQAKREGETNAASRVQRGAAATEAGEPEAFADKAEEEIETAAAASTTMVEEGIAATNTQEGSISSTAKRQIMRGEEVIKRSFGTLTSEVARKNKGIAPDSRQDEDDQEAKKDEEIKALIAERKAIDRKDKERLKDVSNKIKQSIRDKKKNKKGGEDTEDT